MTARKANEYHRTPKLILRRSGLKNGCREFFREHKVTGEYFRTHLIEDGRVTCFFKIRDKYDMEVVFNNSDCFAKDVLDIGCLKEISYGIMSPYGYGFQNSKLGSAVEKHFPNTRKITLTDQFPPRIAGDSLITSLSKLEGAIKLANTQNRANINIIKGIFVDCWQQQFPNESFDAGKTGNSKILVMRNLDDRMIKELTADDVEAIGNFYIKAAQKFKQPSVVKKLQKMLQQNAQKLTLVSVIREYEKLIDGNVREAKWQKFFNDNILLFDSRYVQQLETKNIAVGLTKYPDLLLVDIYGYLDLYELKTNETKLLRHDESRKNYYWSDDVAKAIGQVSVYLQHMKNNAPSLADSIEQETSSHTQNGIKVDIVNPKAFLVVGNSSQLTTKRMKTQFKALRESMKDIEIIFFDEFLARLKNLQAHVNNR